MALLFVVHLIEHFTVMTIKIIKLISCRVLEQSWGLQKHMVQSVEKQIIVSFYQENQLLYIALQ